MDRKLSVIGDERHACARQMILQMREIHRDLQISVKKKVKKSSGNTGGISAMNGKQKMHELERLHALIGRAVYTRQHIQVERDANGNPVPGKKI